LPGDFQFFFEFTAVSFEVVLERRFPGRIVAVFLETVDLCGKLSQVGGSPTILGGVGGEELVGFGSEKELGKPRGSDLQADLRNFTGVFPAEQGEEVVLANMEGRGMILSETPLLVAAPGFPIGDITLGDADVVFIQGVDDS
jgi:hypothetical protein